MTWYVMLETIDEYEEGETYGNLPDELMDEYPDSYEVVEEDNKEEDPFA